MRPIYIVMRLISPPLARGGLVFDQHYVMPTCSPTRCGLLTGYYPSRFGVHGAPQKVRYLAPRESSQMHPPETRITGQLSYRLRQWVAAIQAYIAATANYEKRGFTHVLRKDFEEPQGRTVGTVKVVEDEKRGASFSHSFEKRDDGIK